LRITSSSASQEHVKMSSDESKAKALATALNPVLQGPSIYAMGRFAGVRLSDDTFELLARQPQLSTNNEVPPSGPSGDDVFLLNRLLLQDYFLSYGGNAFRTLSNEEVRGLKEHRIKDSDKTELMDFTYESSSPDTATKLEKRKRGFDFPEKANQPRSIGCVSGTFDDLMKQKGGQFVPGVYLTVTHDRHGRFISIVEQGVPAKLYPKGVETYYIPKEYANAFFHLCTAVVSRVPLKSGAGQSSKAGIQPSLPIR